jgi:DNA mismatch endonuclease (patch repair protein)
MADVVTPEKRSEMMAGIPRRDTSIEVTLRRELHARGFRYSLDRGDLPGRPDIVLPRYRAVIFVNGCFWHFHDCRLFKMPATNRGKWQEKLKGNRARDQRVRKQLLNLDWRVLDIWECSLRGAGQTGRERVADRAAAWIRGGNRKATIRGRDR